MLGTIINFLAIIGGSLVGIISGKIIKDNIRETLTKGLGLAVLLIGFQMAQETQHILILILSLVLGSILGEVLAIERILQKFAEWIEKKVSKAESEKNYAKGFVTGTLVYCIGAMAIMGPLQSGLTGDNTILYTKSILDGVFAMIFATTMGLGIAFSAFSVLFYQGSITLLAVWISAFLSNTVVIELNAVGGLLIFAIGLNMLEITKIRVGNMLPAIILSGLLAGYFGGL